VENVCGDGDEGPTEACDDGNTVGGDGCDASCVLESCGNRVVDRGETCDDGNDDDDDDCTALCRAPECGDGLLSPSLGEECDDGNAQDADACPSDCTEAVCGDGDIESDEGCDDGRSNGNGSSECTAACSVNACGDGYLFGGEQCEPGQPIDVQCSDLFLDAIGTPSCNGMCFIDDSVCAQGCDPLLQDCAGLAGGCIPAADAFYCFAPGAGADGDACTSHFDCYVGLLCVSADELEGCDGTNCCTNFCDVGLESCSEPESCVEFFPPGEAPPELADVGYCRVP
jgi:cysteine-rich repeat protein